MELKTYLQILKLATGETSRKVAEKLGITHQYLSKIAAGMHMPSRKLAKRIEDITHGKVTCLELLYPED